MKEDVNCPGPIRFSVWLNDFIGTLKGTGEGHVPCGECVGCCTSSYFIHLKPTDRDSFDHIPKKLIFPAPGLPKGHYLMGYDEKGHCPMFRKGRCSIYAYRPETCRQYDCRVYRATGIFPEDKRSRIYKKAKGWKFDIDSFDDLKAFEAVQRASKFIAEHRGLFPKAFFPVNAAQQAVLAVRIHSEFMRRGDGGIGKSARALADSIVLKYGNRGMAGAGE